MGYNRDFLMNIKVLATDQMINELTDKKNNEFKKNRLLAIITLNIVANLSNFTTKNIFGSLILISKGFFESQKCIYTLRHKKFQ